MRLRTLIVRSLRFHWRGHLGVLLGAAVGSAALIGALVVGDSLKKDVALARRVGAVDCWAEYGTYVPEEYLERLNIVSARSITRRHAASVLDRDADQPPSAATHSLSNFWQLLSIIDARR